ncbi:MAG: hypothetical protein WCQ69_09545 [Bacteroidales bacterium]|jgi:hypothetical protein|nr:hypothetical protein [Bacteroidales bacterium]MDD2264060.1 hypothetical protein [Bacteroidales bacterium]MDD2831294.1 hypothetical protein [Bacteroidales bacterium]MDD3208593.1 hypothetical protein [Bacteroidales bacterium]MDD3697156.1 hypothetical protein [Bacteroidales bacterium]
MYFKKLFILLLFTLLLTSCIEREAYLFTYTVEGEVKNIVNMPLQGIEVIMHRSYDKKHEADTALTDSQGKYTVAMTLTSRQRVFIVEYSDPGLKYRDTLRRFTFGDQTDKSVQHQMFKIFDSMMLRSRTQVDPF